MTVHPMDDTTVVITGGNSGIGLETAVALAASGADVVLGCRSDEKAAAAVDDIRRRSGNDSVVSHRLDLADLDSVKAFAGRLSALDRIDVLVNNAGMLLDERRETAQGFEAVFGTNHLGPFLLTNLLLDQVRAAPAGRIVNVASFGHAASIGGIQWGDIGRHRQYSGWRVYGDSKLANILHAEALTRRVEGTGVVANALHPGGVSTNFGRDGDTQGLTGRMLEMDWLGERLAVVKSAAEGAATSVHLASSPEAGRVSGGYWVNSRLSRTRPWSRRPGDADELWARSQRMIATVR